MRNRTYGGVRGRKTKVGRKLLRFPPTRLYICGEHIAKVFSYPSWKCGSFQNLGITEYVSLALTMLYVCVYT